MKILLFAIMFMGFNSYANEKGNGGDSCEKRIKIIKNDIEIWLLNGSGKELKLKVTPEEYTKKMLEVIKNVSISCPMETQYIGNSEKTCINFVDEDENMRIKCNFERFNRTSQEGQYILIHHEFAGLAGLEENSGEGTKYEESDYHISNQLSFYDKVKRKLSVKKKDIVKNSKGSCLPKYNNAKEPSRFRRISDRMVSRYSTTGSLKGVTVVRKIIEQAYKYHESLENVRLGKKYVPFHTTEFLWLASKIGQVTGYNTDSDLLARAIINIDQEGLFCSSRLIGYDDFAITVARQLKW